MRLLAATRSRGKQEEFRRLLEAAGHEVIFPDDAGIMLRPELEDGLEVESTFEGNARRKAEYFATLSGMPTIADDSGLEVIALGGAPGVRSKRWAGVDGTEAQVSAANNAELLRRLAGAPATKRTARYRCVIVYFSSPTAAPAVFEGSCPGRILEEPDGTGGFRLRSAIPECRNRQIVRFCDCRREGRHQSSGQGLEILHPIRDLGLVFRSPLTPFVSLDHPLPSS